MIEPERLALNPASCPLVRPRCRSSPSRLHLPFFTATRSPPLPSPSPRSLPDPEACAAGAESVLQPRCEWRVSPVRPSPLPVAAGSAEGERPITGGLCCCGSWKPLTHQGPLSGRRAGNFSLVHFSEGSSFVCSENFQHGCGGAPSNSCRGAGGCL